MIVRYEVFDEDYIPEEILFRDTQISRISFNLKPAMHKSRPVNMLCLGPPATGKTTVTKHILNSAEDYLTGVYINCQINQNKQQIFSRIFQRLYGYIPPSGLSFQKLYSAILKKIVERDEILFIVLDDINFLPPKLLNEVLHTLLKGHEELQGFKIGIAGISTDMRTSAILESKTLSLFHPDEIVFPVYDLDEMMEILRRRAEIGVVGGKVLNSALELIVEKAFEYLDLRFGINLLKLSILNADRKGKDFVDAGDVEEVIDEGRGIFFKKMVSALSKDEIEVLLAIYTSEKKFTGEIYSSFFKSKISYTKFYEILRKLENLRLIDTAVRYDKGLRRYVVRRFKSEEITSAVEKYSL